MKAVCWHGANDVRVDNVPDPTLLNPRDAILKVTATTICGSDLHIYDGYIPSMQPGDIIGHEFMGEIVETGREVKKLKKGDRVVVSSIIGCGQCHYCSHHQWSLCDNSNPNGALQEPIFGFGTAGIFGYSHLFGGYAGSQAQYVRIPFADHGCIKVPDGMTDEQALPISDAFPTGYMGADMCDIKPRDVVAVWGCGPVGLFAIKSAYLLGAEKVIAIDRFPERLQMAKTQCNAEVINYEEVDAGDALKEMTGGRGPDACIDAVGLESHGTGVMGFYDEVKQSVRLETDRPHVLRQMIVACKKGGVISVMGVYAGFVDKMPMGAAFNKGLTFKMGQMHGQRYMPKLIDHVLNGDIDPAFVFSHHMPLTEAKQAYEMFKHKTDQCIKVLLRP
ncbi:molecular chaperone GroES [Leptolyngbya boryana NIES-2135]|jgi:threonine dehydrogenase-like Zn-dependent dehydrogenase|uniref:Molecular chaperone GroES n=1 Tax=Leptolyngbya boryana NIES-2135 TaxID=1973484 RepID=A0A1Z4JE17_LEPBY|nr:MULTISPECIES: zinc-dependent alcohol dehydrogenase [Leptolyngbya]BAY55024.1 molecular chaperone GroES [Leptolyngbya boryana NIES-2135]MBD2366004.1 glutathione-dependent formaldehyde dehydrogenase [Leptolyngbya sp. FACHB-161]MBD2372184.1 glutathione-dependent formaldehyde dehydrogenase [Leptolyngbya sp. FACHB-238]MBD2396607.1 glutathione-dependent formaldehyde dehydrogenase [Leptolyngbya sp. FACHB-239]MBD2403130.1 glutathione-dependent formaldehyde dehydrogenase [Leptolyngbya sp. FACHB-402]